MQDNLQLNTDGVTLLFENSWEVCNKVGGIYTVLSTKARVLHERFGDRLIFIGPDCRGAENPAPDFIERKTLLKSAASKLSLPDGLSIRVGRWNIPGSPIAVLVKYDGIFSSLNDIFSVMWENYKVDSLHANGDYEESCAFAVASAMVMKALAEYLGANPAGVIGHFNEWTTGMGLLWLKLNMPEAATVFTAHATCIGRSICGNGKPLYEYFRNYNGDQMAAELNMESKHSLEKAAAHQADCFTAVSTLTADECEQLLEIRPKVVTPNGFEPDFVPGDKKYASLRSKGRKHLFEVAKALKGKDFDDSVTVVATSGRNEYRNKGIDLFLDSLVKANEADSDRRVLALVLVPAWTDRPSDELRAILAGEGGDTPSVDFLTHRLHNEDYDPTACRIRTLEAEGRIGGNVDVIFVPCYLDGNDGILNISYYDFLPALDLTVFPSYYEPWGYTPLESIAFGVPTVTTDKSGFGQWIQADFTCGFISCGVDVVPRTDSNYDLAASAIGGDILKIAVAGGEERRAVAKAASATAGYADWQLFIPCYYKAFADAFASRDERCPQTVSASKTCKGAKSVAKTASKKSTSGRKSAAKKTTGK